MYLEPGTFVCRHNDVYGNAAGDYKSPMAGCTGSDGNMGVKAVKEKGGTVLAQSQAITVSC